MSSRSIGSISFAAAHHKNEAGGTAVGLHVPPARLKSSASDQGVIDQDVTA
jgi:hypothetical protein